MKQATAREIALDILTKVDTQQAYSNLLLNQTLQNVKLARLDAALATEIVYGTIQRRNTIDYFLQPFIKKGVHKLQPWVRNLLRLSFYQLYYLDKIPVHAIVNEAVNLARRRGHQGISGLVNAVLRNVIRSKEQLVIPQDLAAAERIALTHSHPAWMVSRWISQFGEQTAEAICAANNQAPSHSVRVNSVRAERSEMLTKLREQQYKAEPSTLAKHGILIENGGNIAHSDFFLNGELSIQDESSILVAQIVDPKPGMDVLDCCAAPGGKSAHLAELIKNQGNVWANDVHAHKQALIDEQAKRLGLDCIRTMTGDARQLTQHFAAKRMDRILVDAPCSGLGVIRRKPDVKWSKLQAEIHQLPKLQLEILSAAAQLLKPGGVLVYSTCTLEVEENEQVIAAFLSAHPDFTLDASIAEHGPISHQPMKGMVRIFPYEFHSDGFTIAKLTKQS